MRQPGSTRGRWSSSRSHRPLRAVLRFGLATVMALAVVVAVPTRSDATPSARATEVAASSAADIPDFAPLCTWFRPRPYGYVYRIYGFEEGQLVVIFCHVAYSPTECEAYSIVSGDGGRTWGRNPDIVRVWCFT